MPIKTIARVAGCSKNTVKKALAADGPPAYVRPARGFGGGCGGAADPGVVAGDAGDAGDGNRGANRLGVFDPGAAGPRVSELRPVYLPPDPASRTSYLVREIGQCDFWFPDIKLLSGSGRPGPRPSCRDDDGDRLCPLGVGGVGAHAGLLRTCMPAGGSSCGVWAGCRGCWRGTVRARSGGGGLVNRAHGCLSGFPRRVACEGADLQAGRPGG